MNEMIKIGVTNLMKGGPSPGIQKGELIDGQVELFILRMTMV